MTEPYSNEPVEVAVPCNCPGSPHEGDTVYLARHLSMEGGLAVDTAMNVGTDEAAVTMAVALALIHHGVLGWTFMDADGKSIPVTPGTINRMLPYARGGREVSNRAASLYQQEAFGPLDQTVRRPSKASRTNGQTRPLLASRDKPRRRRSASSSRPASAGQP